MASHPIVHVEFPSNDLQASGRFYAELFGWGVEHHPEMNYATFEAQGGPGGGFPQVDGQVVTPGAVLVYVGTDDIDASLAKAESLGGQTVVPKTEIPSIGWFGVFTDPTGNRVALYTPRSQEQG
jgi:predicted enzyme related to lactoylglutathione lyase